MTFQEYCDLHDIRIKIDYSLTCAGRGFCYNDGEEYHVFINGRLGYQQQRKTTIHEIIHIMENHFYKPAEASSVDQCEEEVHEIIKKLKIFEREGEDLCLIIGD